MSSASQSSRLLSEPTFSNVLKNYKTCLNCGDTFKNYNVAFSGCQHDYQICNDCYTESIQRHMSFFQAITCPLCSQQILTREEGSLTVFQTLPWSLKNKVKSYLKREPGKKMRTCIMNECDGAISNEICQKCAARYCFRCKKLEHPLDLCQVSSTKAPSTEHELKTILICEKCDFVNKIVENQKKKKLMIKCGNSYCKVYLCLEHNTIWNLAHDELHPEGQRIVNPKMAGCDVCMIY